MAGSLPAKKRRVDPICYVDCSDIDEMAQDPKSAYADDSSSAASFLSPKSLDSDEEDFAFETGTYVPEEGSQESDTPFSPDLGTQPPPKTPTTKVANAKPKKRKVSMSPMDPLARSALLQETPKAGAAKPKRSSPTRSKKELPTHNQESKKRPAASVDAPAEEPHAENPISVQSTVTPASKKSKVMDVETEPPTPVPKTVTSTKTAPSSSAAFKETLEAQSTPAAAAPKAKAAKNSKSKSEKAKKTKPNEAPIVIKEASSTATNKKTTSKKASTDPPTLKEQSTKVATSKKQSSAHAKSSAPAAQPATKVQKTAHHDTSTKSSTCSSKTQSTTGSDAAPSKAVSKEPAPAATTTTKKKKKKRSFQDELLLHMFLSCKPFAVKDLAKHMSSNESAIEFSLLSLLDKQWVVKKDFTSKKGGRSKELYWANQTAKNKELSEILRFMSPEELREAHNELTNLQRQEVSLAKELGQIMQEPSNDDLTTQLENAEKDVQVLETRLQATLTRIQSTQQKPSAPQKGKKGGKENNQFRVKIKINKMRAEWKKRKEKCIDFIDMLADGMEKKVKDCLKLLELETDESEGVKMPPKHVVD